MFVAKYPDESSRSERRVVGFFARGADGVRTDSVLDWGGGGGPQACKPRKPRMYRSMYGAMDRFGNSLQPRLCQPPQLWQKMSTKCSPQSWGGGYWLFVKYSSLVYCKQDTRYPREPAHETTKSCTHLGRMVCAFVLLTAQAHALLLSPQARLSSGSRRSPSPVLRAVPPAGFQWGEADRERTADRTLRQLDGTLLNRAVRLGNHVPAFASLTYFGLISMTMQNMRLMPDMAATLRAVITRSVLACQPARLSRLR